MAGTQVTIRPATEADAPAIARLLLLAMQEIVFAFIGERDETKARSFMDHLVARTDNQYGWPHAHVAMIDGQVVGAVCVYEGARLLELRAPVLRHLHEHFGRTVSPEAETSAGEWYIDTLGVDPTQQGKGIGSALLQAVIAEHAHVHGRTLGLLVDEGNPAARKLYIRSGFTATSYRTLLGKRLEHLQYAAEPPAHRR